MTDTEYKCCICEKVIGSKDTLKSCMKANMVGYVKNNGTRYYHMSCLEDLCQGKKPDKT